jgi:hypothetical protein
MDALDDDAVDLIRHSVDSLATLDKDFVAFHSGKQSQLMFTDCSERISQYLGKEFIYIVLTEHGATAFFNSGAAVLSLDKFLFLQYFEDWCYGDS